MSHNTNIMATYKNTIDTSTDVSGGNKSILINAAIQWPWSGPGSRVNFLSLPYNASVNVYNDNFFLPILNPYDIPYDDNILDAKVVYER